jgi:hypothetical protein
MDIDEFASQVATDNLNVIASVDQDQHEEENEEGQQVKHPSETDVKHQLPVNEFKNMGRINSTSSDLDKTFSPEIISVNSDITDISYHRTSTNRKSGRRPWRKWRRIREDFSDTCRQHDMQSPLSALDTILDALCSGPSNQK